MLAWLGGALIVAGSTAFSQVLAFSGATRELLDVVTNLPLSSFGLLVGMLAVTFFLGMFIEEVSIMMITLPIYMPLVGSMDIDPIWFGILMLLVLEIALLTPPVGLLLYTMTVSYTHLRAHETDSYLVC